MKWFLEWMALCYGFIGFLLFTSGVDFLNELIYWMNGDSLWNKCGGFLLFFPNAIDFLNDLISWVNGAMMLCYELDSNLWMVLCCECRFALEVPPKDSQGKAKGPPKSYNGLRDRREIFFWCSGCLIIMLGIISALLGYFLYCLFNILEDFSRKAEGNCQQVRKEWASQTT